MSGTEQSKKKPVLRIIWSSDQENMLLDLWSERIEELRGVRKNSHIFQEIAAMLKNRGFLGNWTDVRTKVDNLTRKYRQEKAKVGPSGGTPSSWEHYHKVNNILGSFRLHNIREVMRESTDISRLLEEPEDIIEVDPQMFCTQELSTSSLEDEQQKKPKKRKLDVNSEMVRLTRERNNMQIEIHKERTEQINQIKQRLDTICEQNAAFQTELLSILREKK